MQPTIFSFIRRYSWRQQLYILGLTLLAFPPLYFSLELPKTIINEVLSDPTGPYTLVGFEFSRVGYLFVLCGIFLCLVLIGGAVKYIMNVYAGVVAERMLRRLRYQLYEQVLRFPLPHFRRVSQGELVQMINAETEALGGYVGSALSVPAFQGGTLITILVFMFMQDWILGLSAIALYPLQAYLIPKLQAKVNALGKLRVRQVRRNAERISETVGGVRDIRANDAVPYELAKFSRQLGNVFWIRFDIYKKKFLIKFINNFIAQLGPFFFFSIGGYLVITGDVSLGALVAVVGAHKDLSSPWKELLNYYQQMFDVKIKYEQTVAQFVPSGLVAREKLHDEDAAGLPVDFTRGELRANNLSINGEGGDAIVDGVDLRFDLPTHVAVVGGAGSGKEELTLALAGMLDPAVGRVSIGEHEASKLPLSVLGRRIAFIGSPPYVFAGSIQQNVLFGLIHRPLDGQDAVDDADARERREAELSGNSVHSLDAEWVDWASAGLQDTSQRLPALMRALEVGLLVEEIYSMGLRGTLAVEDGEFIERLLRAREVMRERLESDPELSRLVERFDPDRYNTNASLAENLLFGTPVGEVFELDNLAREPHVLATLQRAGLVDDLRQVGLGLAQTMVELFADLPPEHEYFRQFSFIAPEELPDYRALVSRADAANLDALSPADRERLMALPFKLVVARHRLGLVDETLQERIVEARKLLREHLPAHLEGAIAFFEPERYNQAASIQDNILFGKVAYGQANAARKIGELVTGIIEQLDLKDRITEAGLHSEVGVAGGRLSAAQRQKVAIARAVLKRPDMLVLYEPISSLEASEQAEVRDKILEEFRGRTVIWALNRDDWATHFDRVVEMDKGRVKPQSPDVEDREAVNEPDASRELVTSAA